MTLNQQQAGVVISWIKSGMASQSSRPIDDLHLDAIDPTWKDKKLWLSSAIAAYLFALRRRDDERLPVSVVLVMSLRSATDPLGVNFNDKLSLEREFDWSPPALYLIRDGEFQSIYGASRSDDSCEDYHVRSIPVGIIDEKLPARDCLLLEFKKRDSIEYSRALHLIG